MDLFTKNWTYLQDTFPILTAFVLNVIAAIVILIIGFILAGWFRDRIRKSKFGGKHVDATIRPVIASSIFYVVVAMTIYAFLRKLGIDAASLLAVFGAAGLAIGLALRDTLSNIASGVMLLVLRPLQIGDFVDTSNFAGTVQEIGLFATNLKNLEGVYLYVPNSAVWNSRLTNFGRHTERRLIVDLGVAYDCDLEHVKKILLTVMNDNPKVQDTPAMPECHVMGFGDSAINISCPCWLPDDNWLFNSSDIRIAIKAALDDNQIEIPFPQRVVTSKT